MNQLDRIVAGVADHASVPSATVQLLHNIAEQVRVTAGNGAASEQLADSLHEHAAHISGLVLANTPVVTALLHPEHAQIIAGKVGGDQNDNPAA
jgi:hypothetical protein